MKFVLLVEGKTERKAIREFIHRALSERLTTNIGVRLDPFEGAPEFVKKAPKRVEIHLTARKAEEIIGVIGLLDLYGLPDGYGQGHGVEDRYLFAKERIEREVGQGRFRQFFAVHETEAWLLSDPGIFPSLVRGRVEGLSRSPERVNLTNPPAKQLEDAYRLGLKRGYRKVVDGQNLFAKLPPQVVLDKCPYFKRMIDEMVGLATSAGA